MLDYARLRYRIYRAMGYMEEQLWNSPLQAELEWSDTTALHFKRAVRGATSQRA